MIIPGMAIFAVFVLIPVIQTAYYSLTDWNGLKEANFIGFSNYIELLTSETSRFISL